MQNFKTFISEEHNDDDMEPLHIEADSRRLENNKDAINADFDRLTAAPYKNPIIFYDQIRATLERYAMIVPSTATKHFMNFDAELVFKLGDSPYFLYVVFNTKSNATVDGYAQVVDDEELDHLLNSDDKTPNLDDDAEEEENLDQHERHSDWYRKRDDDSGNDSEY